MTEKMKNFGHAFKIWESPIITQSNFSAVLLLLRHHCTPKTFPAFRGLLPSIPPHTSTGGALLKGQYRASRFIMWAG